MLEGRTRTLRGPSTDLSPVSNHAPAVSGNVSGTIRAYRLGHARVDGGWAGGVTPQGAGRRFRLGSATTALVLAGLVLVLVLVFVDIPLARLAHQSLNSGGAAAPVWFAAALGLVGFVVAWRKPVNPLGWLFLAAALLGALSQDASFYAVADYQLRHGGLPLGWMAVLAVQPPAAAGQLRVDRRFNRARYDADQLVAAFAARLKDTVDMDSVRDDLASAVHQALEPAHVSVWISEPR
jgi:hypothetical protein